MTTERCDVLIIGGGLVGLATAMHLQKLQPHLSIHVVEKETRLASQQSGRSSGVAHAGIYYKPGSMKARFCTAGKDALRQYCEERGIPYIACGKVIVASDADEAARLELLLERGEENGVPELRILSSRELRQIEPNVRGVAALYSPQSAIVDYARVAESYGADFSAAGGTVHLDTAFESAGDFSGRLEVRTSKVDFDARLVVNCAGLQADLIARKMNTDPGLRIIPFRGDFFDLVPAAAGLVKALVYPVPDPALPFLGVHLTPTTNGAVRAGPNAILATKREGYLPSDFSFRDVIDTLSYPGFWMFSGRYLRPGIAEINRSLRKSVFVAAVQKLLPGIEANDLVPSPSGVRAQAIDADGHMVEDFRIEESDGVIHVLNAPSPAATSSWMIGKHIAGKAELRINAD